MVYTLLRLPSFFEPHWYTDEAGYVTAAREMLRGKVLYAGIWNNKPPLQLWTAAAGIRLFGSSEAGLHLITYVAGLVALSGMAYGAFRLLSPRRAVIAVLTVSVILGTPIMDAELLIPESLLIAATSWAGALLLVGLSRPREPNRWGWTAWVGILAAAAVAYQQTALADGAAFFVILLIHPRATRAQLAAYLAAFAAATSAWLVPSVVLAGPSKVAFALAGFYVPYTASVLPGNRLVAVALAVSMLLAALLAFASALALRARPWPWAAGLWSVATLLAAGAPQHPYAHLVLPAVVPTTLALGGWVPLVGHRLLAGARVRLGVAAMAAAVLISFGLAQSVGLDWVPPPSSQSTVVGYYGGFVLAAARIKSMDDWSDSFDARVAPDAAVAAWLDAHGLSGSRAVVWSSDAWLYLLADLDELMPTPPIYNNFVLLGNHGEVSTFVEGAQPEVIVTNDLDTASFPEIMPLLFRDYTEVFGAGLDHVWVRNAA
ncbi:MAG TPA: glycosyltransferase family 39 protein [Candidatus Baltobacterales bacterium]|nr:glycosyltransferase family 39 protein [Candidatus Baltobacterales bacterium]